MCDKPSLLIDKLPFRLLWI